MDKEYRVSEKEEIQKYMEIGKTPEQYFADQKMRLEFQSEKKSEESRREDIADQLTSLGKETSLGKDGGMNVSRVKGEGYE